MTTTTMTWAQFNDSFAAGGPLRPVTIDHARAGTTYEFTCELPTVEVPAETYDKLVAVAHGHGITVEEVIASLIEGGLQTVQMIQRKAA